MFTCAGLQLIRSRCFTEGKTLVVLFYLETCPFCVAPLHAIDGAAGIYPGAEFVHVECSDNKSRWKSAIGIHTFPAMRIYRGAHAQAPPAPKTADEIVQIVRRGE